MPEGAQQMDTLLLQAARMRVEGKTWQEVADALQRGGVVRNWPGRHPEKWRTFLLQAIEERLPDLENEALLIARRDLRDTNPSVSQPAMRAILEHCRKLRGELLKVTAKIEGKLEVDLFERVERYEQMIEEAKGGQGEETDSQSG